MDDRASGTSSVGAAALVMVALAACGGRQGGGSTAPDAPDPLPGGGARARVANGDDRLATPVAVAEVTPAAMCAQIFELRASHCPLVDGFDLSEGECLAEYQRALDDRGPDARAAAQRAGHCLLDTPGCAAASACFDAMQSDANDGAPEQLRACSDTETYAPVGLSAAAWAARKGAAVARFADAASTASEPVEVCGIPAESEWLMGPTCNDGSRPFASPSHAHAARVGNVGAGGRCGSIIDLYEVPCPEGTYAIYIDAYVCPAPDGQLAP